MYLFGTAINSNFKNFLTNCTEFMSYVVEISIMHKLTWQGASRKMLIEPHFLGLDQGFNYYLGKG